jgi:hypothetical protein
MAHMPGTAGTFFDRFDTTTEEKLDVLIFIFSFPFFFFFFFFA